MLNVIAEAKEVEKAKAEAAKMESLTVGRYVTTTFDATAVVELEFEVAISVSIKEATLEVTAEVSNE